MDPAFEGAGQSAGLQVWRIENFEAVPYDDAVKKGFHTGDSYIVLSDESGAAAIKTVELDDQLGGAPVQYREVQEHESNVFLSYFKKGIKYLPGGVKSGFTHVDPDAFEKRLFHVKGRRNVRVKQVEISISNMNQGDCFILDMGKDIYVYCGATSRRIERLKAVMAANDIRDSDHAGDARVHIGDESAPDVIAKFFENLGEGSADEVPEKGEVEDDAAERTSDQTVSLHRVSDQDGELYTVKIGEKPLKQDMLESGDAFILDTGSAASGIFVWIGKGSSKDERVKAMELAGKFIRQNGFPNYTKINRIVEGGETTSFKQYFSTWKETSDVIGFGRVYTREQIAASLPEADFDVSSLHAGKRRLLAKNAGKAFGFMPDDGSGSVEIYRVEDFELTPNDDAVKGIFFAGDSYVIKYSYETASGGAGYVIYFWQGNESTQDEKAASAIHAVKIDDEVGGGKAVQVRVVQGEEPHHFLTIFRGKLVVMSGGKASGFRNIRDYDTYDADGVRLFRIRGTNEFDTRAEQRPEKAKSLASDDVFLLDTPTQAFLWIGKGASEEEKTMGENIAPTVCPERELVVVPEGEEPSEFWDYLGGQDEYNTRIGLPEHPLLSPRLFHCLISSSGKMRVQEIACFDQDDLNVDDCMVLDTGEEVYVWVGEGASDEEKENAFSMAEEYIRTDPTDRKAESAVILKIKQGAEPSGFKSIFPAWDDELWQNQPSLDDIRAQLEAANADISN